MEFQKQIEEKSWQKASSAVVFEDEYGTFKKVIYMEKTGNLR